MNKIDNRDVYSLYEVTRSIQKTITERYTKAFWIKAEMNKLNLYQQSGHCYPELVEKKDGRVIAEMRSILWRDDYVKINANFLRVLNEPLKNGITILFSARINYDPLHGLSLVIFDIDPNYTLGELEREKQETINKLKLEGLYDLNRSLPLPRLPKRIAVISVESSKGYLDFIKIINTNPWGYNFFHMLFPAQLQGERSIITIRAQLKRIRKVIHHFDVVAIIRGGGGDVGLSSYNNYELCADICSFPIPVITGIGHSTNETVSEMIAFKNAITPTELGDFLIQHFHNYAVPVQRAKETIIERANRLLAEENKLLLQSVRYFKSVTANSFLRSNHLLLNNIQQLKNDAKQFFKNQDIILQNISRNVALVDPINVLKRGYSITYKDGVLLKSVDQLKVGDEIETVLADGKALSKVSVSPEGV